MSNLFGAIYISAIFVMWNWIAYHAWAKIIRDIQTRDYDSLIRFSIIFLVVNLCCFIFWRIAYQVVREFINNRGKDERG